MRPPCVCEQDNFAEACAIAADLQIPSMLDSVDAWLEKAGDRLLEITHDIITTSVQQLAYRPAGAYVTEKAPNDTSVKKFARLMELSQSFALPRFAKAVANRHDQLQPSEKMAVLAAELQLVRAELVKPRPPPRDPLKLE